MLLSIGTTITLDSDYTEKSDKYKSKVVDIEEGFIMIDYPAHYETGRTAFFMDGTELLVSFVENKMSYMFRTEVTGRVNRSIPMLRLSYPGDENLIKIQRREFVRIETAIDVAVDFGGVFKQYVAEDISAGGIALNLGTADQFEENDKVKLTVVLPFVNDEIRYITIAAQAVRIWEKNSRRIVSMQFEEISKTDRQNIIRFCFERQVADRKDKY